MLQNGSGPTGPDQDSPPGALHPLQTPGRVQRAQTHRQEGVLYRPVQGQRSADGADISVRRDAVHRV